MILADAVVAQNVFFGLIAATAIIGGIRMVTTKNVVHAALWLVVVLASVGASFLLLGAEFVGITQILVYIGAIVVLFLFGTMLTRAPIGKTLRLTHDNWGVPLAVAVLVGGLLIVTLIDAFGDDKLPVGDPQSTREVSDTLFTTYLVPFEVVSLLLLAALVGAIVIARRD
jgi:NADH-quinone oxidoreductase subunit J